DLRNGPQRDRQRARQVGSPDPRDRRPQPAVHARRRVAGRPHHARELRAPALPRSGLAAADESHPRRREPGVHAPFSSGAALTDRRRHPLGPALHRTSRVSEGPCQEPDDRRRRRQEVPGSLRRRPRPRTGGRGAPDALAPRRGAPNRRGSGRAHAGGRMSDFDGKVVLVTGCARAQGMGRAISVAFARAGADVVATDVATGGTRNENEEGLAEIRLGWKGLESLAGEIQGLGRKILTMVGDVSRAADAERFVEDALARLGRIDVLVNNAAAPHGADRRLLWEVPEDAWDLVIDVNLKGTFLM